MRNVLLSLVVVGLAFLSVGCKSKNTTEDEDAAKLQNEELQKQLAAKDNQISAMKGQRDEALRHCAELERNPPAAMTSAPGGDTTDTGDSNIEVGRTAEGFKCLRIGDEILFPSGRAEIRKEGEATLKRVADIMKSKYAGHTIRIDGHTDNDPIHKSAKLFQDNWHLSTMRALNVLRFLIKEGVPADKIYVAGFGETRPVGGNDSKAHKAKNRRVEVTVVD